MDGLPWATTDPLTNRGTAFTADERARLGLVGRLPDAVLTPDQQARRAYEQMHRRPIHPPPILLSRYGPK